MIGSDRTEVIAQMKKTGHYAAFIGLLSAVALSVTACGAPAKAPAAAGAAETDTAEAGAGSDTAGAPESAGTDTNRENAAGFQKIDTADSGSSGDTAAAGNEAGQVQAVTGAVPADGEVLSGIPVDAEKSEAVSIYYGSVCYSFFSEDTASISRASARI